MGPLLQRHLRLFVKPTTELRAVASMAVAVARVPAKAAARVTAKVAADLMGKEHRWPLPLVAAAVTVAVAAAVAVATEMVAVAKDWSSPRYHTVHRD